MSVCDGGADADGAGDDFAIIGFDEATSAAEVSGAVENDYLDVSLYQVTSSFRQSGKPQALSTAPPQTLWSVRRTRMRQLCIALVRQMWWAEVQEVLHRETDIALGALFYER